MTASTTDSTGCDDVVDFLRHAGERYKEHIALLQRSRREEERRACPFRPTVTPFAERLHRASATRRGAAVEQRLHELHARQLAAAAQRRADREAQETRSIESAHRPPELTARARSLRPRDPFGVSQAWLAQREARLASLREEAVRREMAEMRAVPLVTARAKGRGDEAVEARLLAAADAHRTRMYWMVEQHAAGVGAEAARPFTPNITARAERMRRDGAVHERLRRRDATEKAVAKETPSFAPRLSPASAARPRARGDVHERLFRHSPRRASAKAAADAADFAPRISDTSRRIVARLRANGTDAPPRPRPPRPAHEAEDAVCTFRPRVNAASARLWAQQLQLLREDGSARTAEEARVLLWQRAQHRSAAAAAQQRAEAERERLAECTFRPDVGRASGRRSVGGRVEERSALWERQRARRRADLAAEAERERLAECTFRPAVDPAFPVTAQSPVIGAVAGCAAHVARQEVSRRRREEAAQWWRPKSHSQTPTRRSKGRPGGGESGRTHTTQETLFAPMWSEAGESGNAGGGGDVYTHDTFYEGECLTSHEERDDYYNDDPNHTNSEADYDEDVFDSPAQEERESMGGSESLNERFIVCQAPMVSSTGGLSRPKTTPSYGLKPSPVDFILNHHHAIVESARRRRSHN